MLKPEDAALPHGRYSTVRSGELQPKSLSWLRRSKTHGSLIALTIRSEQTMPRLRAEKPRRASFYSRGVLGSAKATELPPEGAPDFPPPAATTTNWRPFTPYVAGVAVPRAGSVAPQSSCPGALWGA